MYSTYLLYWYTLIIHLETIIRTVMLFAEGIFEGESYVVYVHLNFYIYEYVCIRPFLTLR